MPINPNAPAARTVTLAVAAMTLAACAGHAPPPASVKAVSCADFNFPVYFQDSSDQLTTAAAQSVAGSVQRTKACHVESLTVVGLGADTGPDLANRRLATVTKALAANGLSEPQPTLGAPETRGGMFRGRRVLVVVRFTPGQ